jgi:hypothetical protein
MFRDWTREQTEEDEGYNDRVQRTLEYRLNEIIVRSRETEIMGDQPTRNEKEILAGRTTIWLQSMNGRLIKRYD